MKPFKVVCIKDDWAEILQRPDDPKKGDIDTVLSSYHFFGYLIYILKDRSNKKGYYAPNFAPIRENYSDETAEILEKFKQTEETPDKILIPEKLLS